MTDSLQDMAGPARPQLIRTEPGVGYRLREPEAP